MFSELLVSDACAYFDDFCSWTVGVLAKSSGPFLEGHGWLSLRDLNASGFRLHSAAA